MIGETLLHYKILDKLGEGGMGAVYLAEDVNLNRKVALKVLPAEMASDPERLERFRREAKMVAALNHPAIVTIFSVEESDQGHFITMEHIEGKSLDRLISRPGLKPGNPRADAETGQPPARGPRPIALRRHDHRLRKLRHALQPPGLSTSCRGSEGPLLALSAPLPRSAGRADRVRGSRG